MIRGVDYSYGRPAPAALKAAGIDFVGRYLWYPGCDSKAIDTGELAGLRAVGLPVVFGFEKTATRALGGYPAGVEDGQQSQSSLDTLHASDAPVYFAVDFDPDRRPVGGTDETPAVIDYFHGIGATIPWGRCGVYAGDRVWQRVSGKWLWQAQATSWSTLYPSPAAHIVQGVGSVVAGSSVDLDTASVSDYGQWPPPPPHPTPPPPHPTPPPTPVPPQPPTEDDVSALVQVPGLPPIYATDGLAVRWIRTGAELAHLRSAGLFSKPVGEVTAGDLQQLDAVDDVTRRQIALAATGQWNQSP